MRDIMKVLSVPVDGKSMDFRLTKMDAFRGQPCCGSASSAAAPVINQTSDSSVQAPVSINVTATGTDQEAVGRSIYDVTERYLLWTLQA